MMLLKKIISVVRDNPVKFLFHFCIYYFSFVWIISQFVLLSVLPVVLPVDSFGNVVTLEGVVVDSDFVVLPVDRDVVRVHYSLVPSYYDAYKQIYSSKLPLVFICCFILIILGVYRRIKNRKI